MLVPITEQEKLRYTLVVQAQKATDELLYDLLMKEKYDGYVDIWPNIKQDKTTKQLIMEVLSSKVVSASAKQKHPDATRFHVSQTKGGVKTIIKSS